MAVGEGILPRILFKSGKIVEKQLSFMYALQQSMTVAIFT